MIGVLMLYVGCSSDDTESPTGQAAKAPSQCKDKTDNDGDGLTDWPDDPGCTNKNDKTETNPSLECDDGIDNDGDSAVDTSDTGCDSPTDDDETDCGDGVCEGLENVANCYDDCGECGNNIREGPEVCDGTSLAGENCITQGFDFGTLACVFDCTGFDTSGCEYNQTNQTNATCGNNFIEEDEVCDGTDLAGEDCVSQGYDEGDLACLADCTDFDAAECINWPANSCTDTDGNYNVWLQGTASGWYNGNAFNSTDYCVNQTNVMEYWCLGTIVQDTLASCNATNCTAGACGG